MKNIIALLAILVISISLPVPIIAASSAITSAAATNQAAFHYEKKQQEKRDWGKRFRIPFKRTHTAVNENATKISNGGIALLLLLSCLVVALTLPGFEMLSVGFYLTGIFFAVLGIGRDKNKTPSIIAMVIATLPVLYFAGWIIYCRSKGCFD
ncbi:MAG: hypothetical protein MUC59_01065 [Saprospiraceae bacterium]|jgi:hypothetical protein|nr:hypothetical protein [Saprospiraceae bacterium]